MAIRILPEHVVRRIRAGEVVERPASLVKELVENAIDSGALRIQIDVDGAGRERIRVADNGCGMSQADLAVCTVRHATSKLDTDDLSDVSTLGFRGEALAAAAAVARLVVISRRQEDDSAWRIEAEDAKCGEPRPSGGVAGTTVEASGLFSGHPARAAFLSSDRREISHIRDVVDGAALAHPERAFSLTSDGRAVSDMRASTWEQRVSDVMGAAFAASSLPFSGEAGGMSVRGRIGLPNWKGHGAGSQRFLVNGRPVRDKTISSALRAAFAPLSRETAPAAVVDLRLPAADVDVNAHPAKSEVRLRAPSSVHDLIRAAAAAALSGGGAASAAVLSAAAAAAAVPVVMGAGGDPTRLPLGRAMGVSNHKYIVSDASDGLVMTDMHAAHERIVYQRLMASAMSGGAEPRRLKSPALREVGHAAAALIEERSEKLARLGLFIHSMDGGCIAVTAVPALLPDAAAWEVAGEVARALLDDPDSDPVGSGLSAICAAVACHAAIRTGDDVSVERADQLLRELEATPNNSNCMHGRPLSILLSDGHLSKMFGR